MILDYRTDPQRAFLFTVHDAKTGESLERLAIYYADNRRAVIERYALDDDGSVRTVCGMPVAIRENRRIKFRIRSLPGEA